MILFNVNISLRRKGALSLNNRFMCEALKQAQIAYKKDETPIGAVIVKYGKIIARAYNKREMNKSATAHAEILAIEKACKKLGGWRLTGCDIYVTLEPCPMCMGAILNARISNIYFGACDLKAGSCGSIINLNDYPYNHKVNIYQGIMQEECATLLTTFFQQLRKRK